MIELGAYELRASHEREFALCTLLVLANVEAGRDTTKHLPDLFEWLAEDYDKLAIEFRDAIPDGYALLMPETPDFG